MGRRTIIPVSGSGRERGALQLPGGRIRLFAAAQDLIMGRTFVLS